MLTFWHVERIGLFLAETRCDSAWRDQQASDAQTFDFHPEDVGPGVYSSFGRGIDTSPRGWDVTNDAADVDNETARA